jgi:hypothetical protein
MGARKRGKSGSVTPANFKIEFFKLSLISIRSPFVILCVALCAPLWLKLFLTQSNAKGEVLKSDAKLIK